jgi:hypothetical protein
MKLAKSSMSSPSSSGSGTPSSMRRPSASLVRPFDVLSFGWRGLVMPISLR